MPAVARIGILAAVLWLAADMPVPADPLDAAPETCAEADIAATERLHTLLKRSDSYATWLLGNSVGTLKAARGHCLSGNGERALLLYRHIVETLRAEEVRQEAELAESQF